MMNNWDIWEIVYMIFLIVICAAVFLFVADVVKFLYTWNWWNHLNLLGFIVWGVIGGVIGYIFAYVGHYSQYLR